MPDERRSARQRHAAYRQVLDGRTPTYNTTLDRSDIVINARGVPVPRAKRTGAILKTLANNRKDWMRVVAQVRKKYDAMPESRRPKQWFKRVLIEAKKIYDRQ
jgi:hypothetical protein